MRKDHQQRHNALSRLQRVFAVVMSLGILVVYAGLMPAANVLGTGGAVVEQRQEEEERRYARQKEREQTVPGDVLDRNGDTLVTWADREAMPSYRNDEAYSLTLGFWCKDVGSHLMLEKYSEDLLTADGGTDKGRTLITTLDGDLQEYAYDLLCNGGGERASLAVLDVRTGEVLALAFTPSFSMKELLTAAKEQQLAPGAWKNIVLGGQEQLLYPLRSPYRPGSVFKLLTSIGILEKGLGQTVIDDGGQGVFRDGTITIRNANENAYGSLTFADAFVRSSNIYFGRMAYSFLGWDTIREISQRAYVGVTQELDFGTVLSTFESTLEPYDMSEPNTALAKVGYGYGGLQLTALHVAEITAGIANDGAMCVPYMVSAVKKTSGYEVAEGQYRYRLGEETESKSFFGANLPPVTELTTAACAGEIREAMKAAYRQALGSEERPGFGPEGLQLADGVAEIGLKTGTAELDESGANHCIWMTAFAGRQGEAPQYAVTVTRYRAGSAYGVSLLDDTLSVIRKLYGA